MYKIYFAGPLFTQGEWLWNAALADQLRQSGVDVILPQEGSAGMVSGQEQFNPKKLFDLNRSGIDSSHAVVAILDQADADSGTCWECGYAFAKGKPVLGVRTDFRATGDDGALNLMLTQSCAGFINLPLSERTNVNWLIPLILAWLTTIHSPGLTD
jgi:nucleoside 2-deoxyribosyltransferase